MEQTYVELTVTAFEVTNNHFQLTVANNDEVEKIDFVKTDKNEMLLKKILHSDLNVVNKNLPVSITAVFDPWQGTSMGAIIGFMDDGVIYAIHKMFTF